MDTTGQRPQSQHARGRFLSACPGAGEGAAFPPPVPLGGGADDVIVAGDVNGGESGVGVTAAGAGEGGARVPELRLPQGYAATPHRRRPMGARRALRQRARGSGGGQSAAAAAVARWAGEAALREQKAAAAA